MLVSLPRATSGVMLFFFFFQAEDGIRDVAVTGVQTCALPISQAGNRSNDLPTYGSDSERWNHHGHRGRQELSWARRQAVSENSLRFPCFPALKSWSWPCPPVGPLVYLQLQVASCPMSLKLRLSLN